MLELHHNDMSTCSQKVRIVLAEKGLDWKSHTLDLRRGDQHDPAYVRMHPNAVVPTLVHDGRAVIESNVINEYLDDAFPDPPLRPGDAEETAHMRLWTKQLDEGVHYATGVISLASAFRYQFAHYSPAELDAHIGRIPDPVRQERHRVVIAEGLAAPMVAGAVRRYDRLLSDMETALQARPWLAGPHYSLADAAYTPYLTRLDHLQYLGMLDRRPRLADWYARCQARPSYERAITAWLNPDYMPLMKEKGAEGWPAIRRILEAG